MALRLLFLCIIVILFYQVIPCNSFLTKQCKISCAKRSTTLNQKQFPSSDETNGYGPVGSLLRQGPVPFFIRIVNPKTYDAAVSKYQALEKCDRITAMANMDAYFQDPNGWAANKLRSRKTGVDIDYVNVNMDKGSLILTGIWATGIIGLFLRIFQVQILQQQ